MVTLKNNFYMPVPPTPHQTNQWSDILKFIEDITPWAAVFGLMWKGIDKVFKYFSDTRDAELRKIVHDEMNPTITELTAAIKELRESIWELKRK